jgi:hypothetical protein
MAELPPRYPAPPLTNEMKGKESWELRVERYDRTEKKEKKKERKTERTDINPTAAAPRA